VEDLGVSAGYRYTYSPVTLNAPTSERQMWHELHQSDSLWVGSISDECL
jgi:hypothetical protein